MPRYRTCAMCGLGNHDRCDGTSNIWHVGGDTPEVVPCECKVCHDCLGSGWVHLWSNGDPSEPSAITPATDPGDKHTGASPCLACSGGTRERRPIPLHLLDEEPF